MTTQTVDYGGSISREIVAWLVYPVLVLGPWMWAIVVIDPSDPERLLPLVFLGMVTAGVMEWIQPHVLDWRNSHNDIVTDIAHQTLSLGLSQVLQALLVVAFFLIIRGQTEAFVLISWPSHWPLWSQAILGLVVAEFGEYWRHRLFHEWPAAWRMHSVHHCSERLYFLNAARFHFVEVCFAGLAGSIPLALCGATTEVVVLVAIFGGLHSNWQHANVRYKLGWLNWIFSGAELHRWHHSSIERHTNSNYGNNLIVFDALFGTRRLPESDQDLDLFGLGDEQAGFPQTWRGQLLEPFRRRRDRRRPASV